MLGIIGVVAGLIAGVAALLMWLETRASNRKSTSDEHIAHLVADTLAPVGEKLSLLTQKLNNHLDGEAEAIRAAVERGVAPFADKITVLETKVAVFWRDVALSSARVIHQPDPRRYHIDKLIEAFTAAVEDPDSYFSPEQLGELRDYLERIRDWEPGKWVGFPVVQGEQAAAVTLLHTMEHALDAADPGPHDHGREKQSPPRRDSSAENLP